MTAIEWLEEQLTYKYECQTLNKFYDWKDLSEIYKQAKEMEKQQIIDAYWGGLNGSINDYSESKQVGSEIIDIKYGKGAEQYYNETYGSKGSDEYTEINWGGVIQKIPIETNGNNVEKVPNVTSPFLEGYEQINQDNPITRGSTALVKVTSSQTEISDEEIEKEANNLFAGDLMWSERIAFKVAIKWYREQLKLKNNS